MDPVDQHHNLFGGQHVLDLETRYTYQQFQSFCRQHNVLPFVSVTLYVIAVFAGKKWMSNRAAYSLRLPLIIWNLMLAAFSFVGIHRMYQEFGHVLSKDGIRATYCNRTEDRVGAFWIYLFVMSKFLEFGDTMFLILRKKPVIFLHWYHHVTALLLAYLSGMEWTAYGRWFVCMNYGVHTIMYSYYAIQAMGIRVPKPLAMLITVLQIMQMFVAVIVLTLCAKENFDRKSCTNAPYVVAYGLFVYSSYFILFVKLFRDSYLRKGRKQISRLDDNSNHKKGN